MPRPRQQEPEPLSEKRFERAVKKLLRTPPQPERGKKAEGERKSEAERPKRPQRGSRG